MAFTGSHTPQRPRATLPGNVTLLHISGKTGNSSRVLLAHSVSCIQRMSTILGADTCGFAIDNLKFARYCKQTLKLYVSLYPWFYMPITMQKLLVHGLAIVKRMILPIGLYSEEAQESRNKNIKNIRLHHSRKDTREHTINDQFRNLLITSDPLISSKRSMNHKKKQPFTIDIISLLEPEKCTCLN